ncbi:hypothetical protein NST54_13940 [Caldifermentibacillus hisashii]|uniref:hypothetical protein n=1 Tax=Caldifermentibacillus hisashii TaxID=996558 RepID=UPI0031B6E853
MDEKDKLIYTFIYLNAFLTFFLIIARIFSFNETFTNVVIYAVVILIFIFGFKYKLSTKNKSNKNE